MTESKSENNLSPQGKSYEELSHFVNADGQHVFTRSWETPDGVEARALALILHGLGEHSGRYDPLAEVLVAKGIRAFAHDHIGHGQSQGTRLDITDYNTFIRDTLQHKDIIKEKYPALPIFLIGHSMGGAIAILSMNKNQNDFAGCVLIGAAIKANPAEFTQFKVFLAKTFAYLMPQFGVGSIDPNFISRQPEEVEDYASDPLVHHGKVKARIGVQLLKAMNYIVSTLESIDWPVLIMHGDEDRLVLVDGSTLMHEKIKSKDKTLKIYPGHYHVLHREIPSDAAIVKQDIVNWIEERIDRKPDVENKEGNGGKTKEGEMNEETKEDIKEITITVNENIQDSEIKTEDKTGEDEVEIKNEE